MKTKNILSGVLLLISFFFASISFTSAQTSTTATKGWKIETTKWSKFIGIYSRYDNLGRLILNFENYGDTLVNVFLYDYDNVGNRTKDAQMSFIRDKKVFTTYYCYDCIFTPEQFGEITKKIQDRLDNKKE